uniref:Ubiquitin-like protease family profile domain-containing protein n=2 Tax=Triticinae TaxID=1648030 RepID=A0A453B6P2_AEGTS
YINSKKMRQMFAGGQCDYALDTCQLIWAIHETTEGYCIMYAFDMDLEILHVFDPKRTCAGIRILERLHHDTCEILLDGLLRCVDAYFEGWEHDRSRWKFKYHDYVNTPCRTEDTQVYGFHYILSFDGMHVHGNIDKDSVDHLRKKLMYLVLQMESNLGYDDPVSDDE